MNQEGFAVTPELIQFGTAGTTQLLIALPENSGDGGFKAHFVPTPGVEVKLFRSLDNELNNGFDVINVYQVKLQTQGAHQPYVVQYAELLPIIDGVVSMITHPLISTQSINVVMPVGGINQQPMSIALLDNSGSTGYNWRVSGITGPLKVTDKIYHSRVDAVGVPNLHLFNLMPTEPGHMTTQLQLIPPDKGEPVYFINIAVVATPPVK